MDEQQQHSEWPALRWPLTIVAQESPDIPCSYFSDRLSRMRGLGCGQLDAAVYQTMMDAGCRRSGRLIYQPICGGCRACRQYRVPTATFMMNKTQRRIWRKGTDLTVTVQQPEATQAKWEIYERYQREWHQREEGADYESFVQFLYDSPTDSLEFIYHDGSGAMLGIGICDITPKALSSVYFYFDPAKAQRRLGTFSALYEIEWAKTQGLPYWYAGYLVDGCSKMMYKSDFGPGELLGTDGVWRPLTRPASACDDNRLDAV